MDPQILYMKLSHYSIRGLDSIKSYLSHRLQFTTTKTVQRFKNYMMWQVSVSQQLGEGEGDPELEGERAGERAWLALNIVELRQLDIRICGLTHSAGNVHQSYCTVHNSIWHQYYGISNMMICKDIIHIKYFLITSLVMLQKFHHLPLPPLLPKINKHLTF